jgi:hypothetical protein
VSPRPFRLTAPVAAEDELHEAVVKGLDVLLVPPAVWACYPAGHIALTGQQASRLARMGLRRGWPDLILIHNGTPFGIELKRQGGKLSRTRTVRTRRGSLPVLEGQRDVFPRLERAGMKLAVCDSLEAVIASLRAWGVPMRGAVS